MSGNSGADLHHQRDLPLRGLRLAARTRAARPTASSSSGRKAPGSPSWRSTAAIVAHVDRRRGRQGAAHVGGRHPRRAPARRRPRLRLRNPLRDALGATRAGRRHATARERVFIARRRRPPDVADRRLRHEHRHPGCRRSRLEARGRHPRLGRRRAARARTRSSGGRSRVRNVAEASRNLRRMLSTRQRYRQPNLPDGTGRRRRARRTYGAAFTETMRHEWFTLGFHLGYRYEDSPVDLCPTARRRRRSKPRPTSRPRGPAHARRTSGCPMAARRSICSAAASCCCGSAPMRPMPRAAARGSAAGVPLEVVALDEPDSDALYERRLVLVRPDGHVAWRADAAPDDARAVIDVVRGARRLR